MTKDIWLNLPVKDVKKSTEFFKAIGFTLNSHFNNSDQAASFLVGDKNTVLMLFPEAVFKTFTGNAVADTTKGNEVLFSISAESREEVDELAGKAESAGGKVYGKPGENQGWMYGCGFEDIDGHRWNVLYMDFEKMPNG